jgi:transposase InsO family protein
MNKYNHLPNNEALFRFQVVSTVLHYEFLGEKRSDAILVALKSVYLDENGEVRLVKKRTLYRWLACYELLGFDGLIPASRDKTDNSVVLSKSLLDFCKQEKALDPRTSIPELIRRARNSDVITQSEKINRTTLWRSLNRMAVDTTRKKTSKKARDCRRFAYAHRMDMVLCDGKHFRAGVKKLRRVALFFIDDATRFVLHVVVGTSESADLFLRGLYECILKYGLMNAIYIDHGPGFIALDTINVIKNLGPLLIHGAVRYPEGHGKIERFNQTALNAVLRTLNGNPAIDSDCNALEVRLRHYLSNQYHQTVHESLGVTPEERFKKDSKALSFQKNSKDLRKHFIVHEKRLVSKDNIISFESIDYEMPLGYSGTKITLYRHVLDKTLSILHKTVLVQLHVVDLQANARAKRKKPNNNQEESEQDHLPQSSAEIAYQKEMSPLIDSEGGFSQNNKKPFKEQ